MAGVAGCSGGSAAVSVRPPRPTPAAAALCARTLAALPRTLEGLAQRPVRPAGAPARAWGTPPVVLRCGVATPAPTVPGNALRVDGLSWLQQVRSATVRWTTLDRRAAVELSVPTRYSAQEAFLVDVTQVLLAHDPQQPPSS